MHSTLYKPAQLSAIKLHCFTMNSQPDDVRSKDEADATFRATLVLNTDSATESDRADHLRCTPAQCKSSTLRHAIVSRTLIIVGIVVAIVIIERLALDPSGVLKQVLLGALAEEQSSGSTLPRALSTAKNGSGTSAERLDTRTSG